jgi:hypothetical protein
MLKTFQCWAAIAFVGLLSQRLVAPFQAVSS